MKSFRITLATALSWLVLGTGCAETGGEELMRLARDAASKGDARTAAIHLRNLLREDPNYADARYLLGQVMLAQADPGEAEAAFRRAIELGRDPAELQVELVRSILLQGKFAEALRQIESGPQLEGENRIAIQRMAAEAYRGSNRPDDAEVVLRAALETNPDSTALRTDYAALLLAQSRLEEGRRLLIDVLTDDPKYVPALVMRGSLERLTGRYDDAELTLTEAIERDGPTGSSYFAAATQLVEVLLAKNNVEAADQRASELLARFPAHPVVVTGKASVELRKGDVANAKRRLEALMSRTPGFGPANRLLGVINAQEGQVEQAQMFLQRALSMDRGDRRALLHLVALHLSQGKVADARDELAATIGADTPRSDAALFAMAGAGALQLNEQALADQLLAEATRVAADDPEGLMIVASILLNAGRAEAARELLRASSADSGGEMAEFGVALTQFQERDMDGAEATAVRVIEAHPTLAWPHNLRGMIAAGRQDLAGADTHFSAALRLESDYLPALLNRARIRIAAGRPADAAADYRKVVELDADNGPALMALTELAFADRNAAEANRWIERMPPSVQRTRYEGMLALAEGRAAEAADKLARVFAAQPTSDNAFQAFVAARQAGREKPESTLVEWLAEHPRDARANLVLGSIALDAKQHARAIEYYEKVIEVQPEQAEALNNLAWLQNESGNPTRALELAKRANAAAPQNPAFADTLGWLHVQHGDAKDGLPLLELSHNSLSTNADVHYHWAVALAKTGNEQRAVQELRALLAAHPQFADRAAAEQLLRELQ